jgi:AraC-like DNA-binding protein/tetratricopeptide (TPR) repeat protein
MFPGQFPRGLTKATELLQDEPALDWTVPRLAADCGIARRTLEKHFRRYLGQSPVEFLRALRLDCARVKLLAAPARTTVTEVAGQCGFTHFGRFAAWYRERFGEAPLMTLQRNQIVVVKPVLSSVWPATLEMPSITIHPFDVADPHARRAIGLRDEIAAAVGRLHWVAVTSLPNARYNLRGSIRTDGRGRLRATITLSDTSSGRNLWADCWNGGVDDIFEFEERVSAQIARGLQAILRDAEIDRVRCKDPSLLTSWELTMRALPSLLAITPAAEAVALELLERAIELAPRDALPISMAAWCRGLRAALHFTEQPDKEKKEAQLLAERASSLMSADSLAETMLVAAHTLSHDLDAAAIHARRALLLDGGSGWAWYRSGWVHAYRGESTDAIEQFQIARQLAPSASLGFLTSIGIASAHFEDCHYEEAVHWYRRALSEQPKAIWINRFLSASFALAGRKDEAKQSLSALAKAFPALTIAQVRSGLPHSISLLDRVSDGLESTGMRLC